MDSLNLPLITESTSPLTSAASLNLESNLITPQPLSREVSAGSLIDTISPLDLSTTSSDALLLERFTVASPTPLETTESAQASDRDLLTGTTFNPILATTDESDSAIGEPSEPPVSNLLTLNTPELTSANLLEASPLEGVQVSDQTVTVSIPISTLTIPELLTPIDSFPIPPTPPVGTLPLDTLIPTPTLTIPTQPNPVSPPNPRLPGLPDLVVTDFATTGTPTVTGGRVLLPVQVSVRNQGGAAADPFKVSVDYSVGDGPANVVAFTAASSPSINPDYGWYPFTRNPLAAGAEITFNGQLTFGDTDVLTQPLTVTAIADSTSGEEFIPAYGRVIELREDNNFLSESVTLSTPTPNTRPDLIVSVTAPASASSGDNLEDIRVTVKNIGDAIARGTSTAGSEGYMVDLLLSSDLSTPAGFANFAPTYGEDVLLRGGRISNTPDLAPGEEIVFVEEAGLPTGIPAGNYNLFTRVDPGAKISEASETNNTGFASLSINPTAPTIPTVNIIATDPSASESGNPALFTITRSGNLSEALTVPYIVGGTATNGGDYLPIASRATLAPGASNTQISIVPINDALVEGAESVMLTLNSSSDYTLGGSRSAIATIADNDLTPLTIDLRGSSFNVVPISVNAGNSFAVDFSVQNTGNANAGNFGVKFYLSTDATINSSDQFLGQHLFSSLAGASNTGIISRTFLMPDAWTGGDFWKTVGDGSYYVGMVIDEDNTVRESNELNNRNTGLSRDYDNVRISNTLPVVSLSLPEIVQFRPFHVRGDRDFDGNGPRVNVGTRLSATDSTVTASVSTGFAETRSDWTTFSGTTTRSTSIASRYPGWKIQSIASPTTDSFQYEDNDYAVNTFVRPVSSPVRQYQIQGDQDGGLFGGPDDPWTSVSFNPVQVRLQRV